ncbi:MAG: LSM domain-containing protein [Thermoplasmata archaeon]
MKPAEVLQERLHQKVLVEMKGGRAYRGTLDAFDQHLNLVLSGVEEVGVTPSAPSSGPTLLRGDSIVYIAP